MNTTNNVSLGTIEFSLTKEEYKNYSDIFNNEYSQYLSRKIRYLRYLAWLALAIFAATSIYNKFIAEPGVKNEIINNIGPFAFLYLFLFPFVYLIFYKPFWQYKRAKQKLINNSDFSIPFRYKFYDTCIEVSEPYQQGVFGWHEFVEAYFDQNFFSLSFQPNSKNYKITIPIHHLENQPELENKLRNHLAIKDYRK